jgi:hypothetical protein
MSINMEKEQTTRGEYQRVLADFIGAFKEKDPWWHCIQGRADDDDVTPSLAEMIGLPNETTVSFFKEEN